ncbi:MAG: phosphoribosylanthranilate isomerase [Pseudomonadota bacterium]|nr:MAG: phosphoribosylanthranilate isomerase [Pseudomonadota bacterium]
MRTRVKICGVTRIEDALAAARAGADAIGLVFVEKSPRHVSLDLAAAIRRELPPFVSVVGLFVNATAAAVTDVLGRVALDLLQFHGAEAPDFCRQFHRPYIKAIAMREEVNLHAAARDYADAAGLLLDTHSADVAGGSGSSFDWARVPHNLERPIVLAGGLTPHNVAQAVRMVRPYAVDVSSGVEQTKGIKDAGKISAFIEAVNQT